MALSFQGSRRLGSEDATGPLFRLGNREGTARVLGYVIPGLDHAIRLEELGYLFLHGFSAIRELVVGFLSRLCG